MGLFLVSHLDIFILVLCLGAALDIISKPPLTIVRCNIVVILVAGGLLGADWVQPHLPSSAQQNPTHSSSGVEDDCEGYDLCFTLAETEAED